MEDKKGMVWVDCRKTSAVVEEWELSGKRLKELAPANLWPVPGSEDTELGVFIGPEVGHGETKVYAGVQA